MKSISRIVPGLLFALCIGYLVLFAGGVERARLYQAWIIIGIVGIAVFIRKRTQLAPPLEATPLACWVFLLSYMALQAIPLPATIVRLLSPARWDLSAAVADVSGPEAMATLSISPAATFEYLVRFAGYFLVFVLARELSWRAGGQRQWLVVLPLAVIGGLEAVLSITQFVLSGNSLPATGTYINRNHLGGFLGMVLPLALAQTVLSLQSTMDRALKRKVSADTWRVCVWSAVCGVLLAAVLCSSSRMAAVTCVISIIATLYLMYRPTIPKLISLGFAVLLFVAILLPAMFVDRFALLTIDEGRDPQTRVELWRDSLPIVREFPITGTGAGTYSTALLRYKTVAPSHDVNFAHNDYLQHLCELGIIGIIPLAILAAFVFGRAARTSLQATSPEQRATAAGCTAAMLSIIIHSVVDFNLYIPANAVVLAAIAGISVMLPHVTESVSKPVPKKGWIRMTTLRPAQTEEPTPWPASPRDR